MPRQIPGNQLAWTKFGTLLRYLEKTSIETEMDGNRETLAWGRGCVVLVEQDKMAEHFTRFELLPKNTARTRGVATFSTSCWPGRLSFTRILQIARMTSRH